MSNHDHTPQNDGGQGGLDPLPDATSAAVCDCTPHASNTPPESPLGPLDIEYLKSRAVSIDLALREGVYGVPADIPKDDDYEFSSSILARYKIGRIYSPRLVVPYHQPLDGIDRVRARNHRTRVHVEAEEEGGNVVTQAIDHEYPRWLAGKGVSSIPYLPLAITSEHGRKVPVSQDASIPIFVTEAPVKALSLISHGFFGVGMAGVEGGAIDSTRSIKRKGVFLPQQELGKISWRGRVVYITYDSGIQLNPAVARGAARLAAVLRNEGADVRLVLLPLMRPEDVLREMTDLGLAEDRMTEVLEAASDSHDSGPSYESLDSETGLPIFHSKESGDEGPDDFLARHERYARYLKHVDPASFSARAFKQLVDCAVPADPAKWVMDVIAARSAKADRVAAVQSLLERLPFQALLATGGETAVGAVSALTQSLGFGKKAMAEAVAKFDARVHASAQDKEPEWRKDLQRSSSGAVQPSLVNARLYLSQDPQLRDVFRYDLFLGEVTVGRKPPWAKAEIERRPIEDADVIELRTYLQQQGCSPKKDDVWDAVIVESRHRPIDPLREYLLGLKWDGVPRIDNWLSTYLGVEASEYTQLAGAWWMQQAADRALHPGCQADHTLVLEGLQGDQKTSTCRALAAKDAWFRGAPLDITNKDAYGLLSGAWIYELGEGAILRRADMRLMKQFLTERSDKWRPPYLRAFITRARYVCFVMTTNDTEYLVDDTGNRRYWPIRCGVARLDDLQHDIDQLWAEAVQRVQANARRWPTREEEVRLFKPEQDKRHEEHIWTERIAKWLEGRAVVSVAEVLEGCLNISADKARGTLGKDVKAVLSKLGWSANKDHGGVMRYHRPAAGTPVKLPAEVEAAATTLQRYGYSVTHTGVEGQYVLTVTKWSDPTDALDFEFAN